MVTAKDSKNQGKKVLPATATLGSYQKIGESMKKFLILAIVLITGLPLLAQIRSATVSSPHIVHALSQRKSATVSPPCVVHKLKQDFVLEHEVFTRSNKLKTLLHPRVRAKLDLITKDLLAHLVSDSTNVNFHSLIQQKIHCKFAHISNEQSNLFNFYVLAEVARILKTQNEMSEMTSLRLQMMMDERSKLIRTLSNIMKKITHTQDTLIENIK